jgi:hypothetical protein
MKKTSLSHIVKILGLLCLCVAPLAHADARLEEMVIMALGPLDGRAVVKSADDIASIRRNYGIGENPTVAAGRTNLPGLEDQIISGLSPSQRAAAGLEHLDQSAPNRLIVSPSPSPRGRAHAEEDLLNQVANHIDKSGLSNAELVGKSVTIHVSQRVCNTCRQGFSTQAESGVLKQFSDRYPSVTLRISNSETSEVLVIHGGERSK